MKTPKVKRREIRFLSKDDYERLLRYVEADAVMKESGQLPQTSLKDGEIRWLADVIRFAVGTGFRLSEICNLRWSSVDLAHGFVTAKNDAHGRTKSGHDRTIPFGQDVRELLEEKLELRTSEGDDFVFVGTGGGTLDPVYVSKRFKSYVQARKIGSRPSFPLAATHLRILAGHGRRESFQDQIADGPPGRVDDAGLCTPES